MADRNIYSLEDLYGAVVAQFASDGMDVPNLFGWRSPAQSILPPPNICWYPGDTAGKAGTMVPARMPGQNPRTLNDWDELFTVEIFAQDQTDPENELKQYAVTDALFRAWWRAVYIHSSGRVSVSGAEWLIEKKERRFGTALRVTCVIQSKVVDRPLLSAPSDTLAEITVSMLSQTDAAFVEPVTEEV